MGECKICGELYCKKHAIQIGSTKQITEFSGSSPPEIFVGRWNYPHVYAGILSPPEYGNTELLSSAEEWHAKNLSVDEVVNLRKRLIYGRSKTTVQAPTEKFVKVMQEVAMTHKPVATEFKLKKPISQYSEREQTVPLMSKAAPLSSVKLQENPKITKKVEYLVGDTAAKAKEALIELEKNNTPTSTLIKLLSAGLLGQEKKRKLVPTRWSITAVDDSLSKEKLKKIRYFPEIKEIYLFNAEYVGNHYEFLLLPDKFSFEVIEIGLNSPGVWQDYEGFEGRTKYADVVTGAYYVNRLALAEYLEKTQRQAQCLVMREIRPEYTAPLGVGILREVSRAAFTKKPEVFKTIKEALEAAQTRIKTPIEKYSEKSKILKEYGKQKRLGQFF